jgi:hypothetical protein
MPGPINQVVLTLLTNAAHAIGEAARTQPGIGHITVSTRKSGACVELEVADTGTGIPDAMQAHLFDPFFAGAGAGAIMPGTGSPGARDDRSSARRPNLVRIRNRQGSSFFVRLPLRAGAPATVSRPTELYSCASL